MILDLRSINISGNEMMSTPNMDQDRPSPQAINSQVMEKPFCTADR